MENKLSKRERILKGILAGAMLIALGHGIYQHIKKTTARMERAQPMPAVLNETESNYFVSGLEDALNKGLVPGNLVRFSGRSNKDMHVVRYIGDNDNNLENDTFSLCDKSNLNYSYAELKKMGLELDQVLP
jgi:hypothetical protein